MLLIGDSQGMQWAADTVSWAGSKVPIVLLVAMATGFSLSTAAHGGPLATDACAALKTDYDKLVAAGLPETVKKGPDWGRANLTLPGLAEVARFITLEEQLLFRCGYAKVKGGPGGESDEGSPGDGETGTETAMEPPPLPRRKPAGLAQPAQGKPPVRAGDADASPVAIPKRKPRALVKPAAKPKVDDAYRPPKPKGPAEN